MKMSKDLVAASVRPLVLAILARNESYGYAIIQEMRERSGGEIEWTEGTLYPVLHRLEAEKLISARWERDKETGRERKYYRLRDKGRSALQQEQAQWSVVQKVLATFMEVGHV